ncbi:MAG: ABC-type transport auxiliary lipoprotein family protein [Hyphomicrobiaceae bacterium]
MEVRARYTLMGLFALLVVLAGFSFVYWLETAGGLAERTSYRVKFSGPVAGLLQGSAVLFNGVRVGEVTAMSLDAKRPEDVVVDVAIERATPVRADTKVTIDFQGLAGAPAVAFIGGTATLPLLAAAPREQHVLTAEANAGQSLSQAGRDALRRFEAVISDNAANLKSAVANINTFTGALARNSDKVDTILAGLERFTGGGKKPVTRIYDLTLPATMPSLEKIPAGVLLIPEPTALANVLSEKIVVSDGPKPNLDNAQWPDVLTRLVQTRLVQAFEAAKYTNVLAGSPDGKQTDFQLLVDVRQFQIEAGASPRGVVALSARILDKDGRVVGSKQFRAETVAGSLDAGPAVKALEQGFAKVAVDLVVWVCGTI